MSSLPCDGTGTFLYFVIANGNGYACKAMHYNENEAVLHVASLVNSRGWYWPEPELRLPKSEIKAVLPGRYQYGGDVHELAYKVNVYV